MSTTTDKPTVLRPPTKQREDPTLITHPPVQTKPLPPPFLDCQIETMPNGEGVANIVIPVDIMKRLKNRSQGVDLDRYTWENVIKPALYAHVY